MICVTVCTCVTLRTSVSFNEEVVRCWLCFSVCAVMLLHSARPECKDIDAFVYMLIAGDDQPNLHYCDLLFTVSCNDVSFPVLDGYKKTGPLPHLLHQHLLFLASAARFPMLYPNQRHQGGISSIKIH